MDIQGCLGRDQPLGPDHPFTLRTVNNLGLLLRDKGDYAGAELLPRWAMVSREKLLGAEHPDTMESVYGLGITLLRSGKHIEAEPFLLREFTAAKNREGELSESAQVSAKHYGACLKALGRAHEAALLLRNYLEYDRDYFRYDLACCECLSGNLEEAKQLITEEIATNSAVRQRTLKDADLKFIHDFIGTLPEVETTN